MAVTEVTFENALGRTEAQTRHLLLGNGFSMGASHQFNPKTLFADAIGRDRKLAYIFADLSKRGVSQGDFEAAMAVANGADQERLQAGLISAVQSVCPKLTPPYFQSCAAFLAQFVGIERPRRGSIFTTNYDILLYRALVAGSQKLQCRDAFEGGEWRDRDANVLYLHGAVHIFQIPVPPLEGAQRPRAQRYEKLRADQSAGGDSLTEKIERRLRRGDYPVFVSHGSAPEKEYQINGHKYLKWANARFHKRCIGPETTLFSIGHSLGEIDRHIVKGIGTSGLETLYFGYYSEQDRERIEVLSKEWTDNRPTFRPPLQVYAFPFDAARVWNSPPPPGDPPFPPVSAWATRDEHR